MAENADPGSQTEELTPRQQQAVERILEDESLTGDLSDGPAKTLISWATTQVAQAAANLAVSDADLSAYGKALRSAVRVAADAGDDAHDLVALAEQNLRSAAPALATLGTQPPAAVAAAQEKPVAAAGSVAEATAGKPAAEQNTIAAASKPVAEAAAEKPAEPKPVAEAEQKPAATAASAAKAHGHGTQAAAHSAHSSHAAHQRAASPRERACGWVERMRAWLRRGR